MVVVDNLDERFHFAALVLAGFRHAAGYLERVAFDAGDEGVWEGVLFAAVVLGLDDDDFLACVAAARDDGLGGISWEGHIALEVSRCVHTTRPTLRTAKMLALPSSSFNHSTYTSL